MMNRLGLKFVQERIQRDDIKGNKLTYLIKEACFNNSKEEVCKWIIENNYFKDYRATIRGVHQSNKWSLLKKEISADLLQRRRPFDFAFCYALFNKRINFEKFEHSKYSLPELLLMAEFSMFKEFGFPCSTILLIKRIGCEQEFGLPHLELKLPNKLKVGQTDYDNAFKIKKTGTIIENERTIFAFNDYYETIFSNLFGGASHFERFLIISSGYIDENSFKKQNCTTDIAQKWCLIEEKVLKYLEDFEYKTKNQGFSWKLFRKLWNAPDEELIGKSGESFIHALLSLRILQSRLHNTLSLNLTSGWIDRFEALKQYIIGLCRIGVFEKEEMADKFKWPELREIKDLVDNSEIDYQAYKSDSPLSFIGYKVGENGKTISERQKILSSFYEGHSYVEDILLKYWDDTWASPKSSNRLKRIAYHIHYQIINKRALGYLKAVEDWQRDLNYLKKTYYDKKFKLSFRFPTQDHGKSNQ